VLNHKGLNPFPQVSLFRQVKGAGRGARVFEGDGGAAVQENENQETKRQKVGPCLLEGSIIPKLQAGGRDHR